MFDVAGGVRCREDVAQRRGYSDRSNAAHSTSLRASSLAATGLAPTLRSYRVAIRDSRIASSPQDKMIDSTASRILALRAARPTHRVQRISIRSLRLIQALGLPTALH